MIKDKNVAWKVKRQFISVYEMLGRAADMVTVLGAGAPVFQEPLAAAQLAGLAIAAAGDEIFHLWKIPWDLDRSQPIQMRIHFIHSSTDEDSPDWLISLKGIANQAAITAANSSADETLTFPALAVSTTDDSLEKTSWQSTGPNAAIAAADLFVQMCTECNGAGSAGANEITLLGVEVAYSVKATSAKRETTDLALGTRY